MKIKTLLLGSAAAFAVIGGAQAADLSVAEPVEYVKVCDYFGTGYFYIPGSDTCLKIGGWVRFYGNFYGTKVNNTSGSHSGSWDFQTQAEVQFTAKSQSSAAMGKTQFQASKEAVLDVLAEMIGVEPAALARAGQRSAA